VKKNDRKHGEETSHRQRKTLFDQKGTWQTQTGKGDRMTAKIPRVPFDDTPTLEEAEAMRRYWMKHEKDPAFDPDYIIVAIAFWDRWIKYLKGIKEQTGT
jgi:hypothetical protein